MKRSNTILIIAGIILSTLLILVGSIMKIQHWPYASLIISIGLIGNAATIISVILLSIRNRKLKMN